MSNAHNTVFVSKCSAICAQAVYLLHSTRPSVTWLNSRWWLAASVMWRVVNPRRTSQKIWGGFLYGVCTPGEWLWINSKGRNGNYTSRTWLFILVVNFRRSVIIAEMWRPEVARRLLPMRGRAQNLPGPAPDNIPRVLHISSKSVHFRRSYSPTHEHRQNAPQCESNIRLKPSFKPNSEIRHIMSQFFSLATLAQLASKSLLLNPSYAIAGSHGAKNNLWWEGLVKQTGFMPGMNELRTTTAVNQCTRCLDKQEAHLSQSDSATSC